MQVLIVLSDDFFLLFRIKLLNLYITCYAHKHLIDSFFLYNKKYYYIIL